VRGARLWTPEREAFLVQHYATYMPTWEILVALNAMAGPAIPEIHRVAHRAHRLNLSRPESFKIKWKSSAWALAPAPRLLPAIVPPAPQLAVVRVVSRVVYLPPQPPEKPLRLEPWAGVYKPSEDQAFSMLGGRVR